MGEGVRDGPSARAKLIELFVFRLERIVVAPKHKVVERPHSTEQTQELFNTVGVRLVYDPRAPAHTTSPVLLILLAQEPLKVM